MKKHLLLFLFLLVSSTMVFAQKKRVIVNEPIDRIGSVPLMVKNMIKTIMVHSLVSTGEYEVFDRMSSLQNNVSVDYVLVVEVALMDSTCLFTASLIDVETAQVVRTSVQTCANDAAPIKGAIVEAAMQIAGIEQKE